MMMVWDIRLYYVKGTGEFEYVDGLWGTVDYDMGEIVINDLIIQSTTVANNQLQILQLQSQMI